MPPARVGPDTFLPILGVRAGDLPPRMLVVGDPRRARMVAERLNDPIEVSVTEDGANANVTYSLVWRDRTDSLWSTTNVSTFMLSF